MGNGVDPGEEDDGPGNKFVKGDVLIERDYVVQWRATSHRD